jgi:tight adherence protein B
VGGVVTAVVAGVWLGAAVWLALVPMGRSPVRIAQAGGEGAHGRVRAAVQAVLSRVGPQRAAPVAEHVRVQVAQVIALLRAGAPPAAAWSRAVGVPVDASGVPDEERLAAVLGGPGHARSVVAAARLAHDVGAPLGAVLEAVSAALVAEAEARSEREAALAGPQTTARVLLWLPVAGVVLGWALGADPLATATDGGAGTGAIGLGLVLLALGRSWTARMVAAARAAGEATS